MRLCQFDGVKQTVKQAVCSRLFLRALSTISSFGIFAPGYIASIVLPTEILLYQPNDLARLLFEVYRNPDAVRTAESRFGLKTSEILTQDFKPVKVLGTHYSKKKTQNNLVQPAFTR